jgi:hypothetical protein
LICAAIDRQSRVPIERISTARLAEQRPEVFWDAVRLACQQLWLMPASIGRQRPQRRHRRRSADDSTRHNNLDDGKPLRPAMVWLDQRRTEA